jgi:hypothetical protein
MIVMNGPSQSHKIIQTAYAQNLAHNRPGNIKVSAMLFIGRCFQIVFTVHSTSQPPRRIFYDAFNDHKMLIIKNMALQPI